MVGNAYGGKPGSRGSKAKGRAQSRIGGGAVTIASLPQHASIGG